MRSLLSSEAIQNAVKRSWNHLRFVEAAKMVSGVVEFGCRD